MTKTHGCVKTTASRSGNDSIRMNYVWVCVTVDESDTQFNTEVATKRERMMLVTKTKELELYLQYVTGDLKQLCQNDDIG